MIGFVNGLTCAPVLGLYPDYEDVFFEYDEETGNGAYTFTVPKGAKTIDITCIGGGAGGSRGGVSYGNIANAWPGGGGSGGTGEIQHVMGYAVEAGESYSLQVGAGGAAGKTSGATMGGAGGASAFSSIVSAAGGYPGGNGGNEPLNNTSSASGGTGGKGGIGGNGGGPGRGANASLLGSHGANGTSTQAWSSWTKSEWYAFRDESTGRRLGNCARGGYGYDLGSEGKQYSRGLSTADAPGTMYGSSGQGGDQQKTGTSKTPGAGTAGLVAIRIHYK